uniref:PH domain-containing protein n=1 Tax=Meloidogyne incognita TaxID=6306 RepID=A0A914KHF2_MELIC
MLQNSQQDIDASSNLNGMNQQQLPLQQQPPFPQHQQQHHFPAQDCTIWMGDLISDWDASYIREAFGQYGKDIVNVKMVTTDQGARKATYCFVEFSNEDSARNAMLDVNGKPFPNDPSGRARFNLAFANSPHQMSVEYNLFVNNLSPDVDDVSLFRQIQNRSAKRNLEINKLCEPSKEVFDKTRQHVSTLIHSFNSQSPATIASPTPKKSKAQAPIAPVNLVEFTSETDRQKALLLQPPSSPVKKKPAPIVPPKPVSSKDKFRPITPTETIIGSLWDDINRELEKYKEERKKQKSDPNLSPKSSTPCSSFSSISHLHSKQEVEGESVFHEKRQHSLLSSEVDDNKSDDLNFSISSKTARKIDSTISDQSSIGQQSQKSQQEVQLKRLHDMIVVQQDQICQASRALAFCRQNDQFRGGREEIDAQRALLIATERRRALLLERDRLMCGKQLQQTNASTTEPKGTLIFSSISIRLSREYINNCVHGGASSINRYYFIILIKCGELIFHTSLASSEQGIKSGFIEFTHYIPIEGLSPDFVCELEIYSLKASQEKDSTDRSARSKKGTWRRMVISTPLNAYSNTFNNYSTGNRPIGVMDPGFQRVGHLSITRQLIGRQKFLLNDTVYPLDGSCLLSMDCHTDENSSKFGGYSSFLSLYQIVSGFGAWNRFWCVLDNGLLNFWRYPEDEGTKTPTVTIELVWCITSVTALPPSAASFPNSMQVDVVPPQLNEGDKKEGVRMLFAADTPNERDYWLENINRAIRNVNIWRPIKRK